MGLSSHERQVTSLCLARQVRTRLGTWLGILNSPSRRCLTRQWEAIGLQRKERRRHAQEMQCIGGIARGNHGRGRVRPGRSGLTRSRLANPVDLGLGHSGHSRPDRGGPMVVVDQGGGGK